MSQVLTAGDRASDCWAHIKRHFDARLQTLRAKLELNLTPEQTAKVRGQIAEVHALLSLGTDKPLPPPEDTNFMD